MLLVGLGLMAAATLLRLVAIERVLILQGYNIDAGLGARYVYEIGAPSFPFDTTARRTSGRSEPLLRVMEDGRQLGPRLWLADRGVTGALLEIERDGAGRHAVHNRMLHFSASDGGDPRSNGRFYHLAYTLVIARSALITMLSGGALLAMLALVARYRRGARLQ